MFLNRGAGSHFLPVLLLFSFSLISSVNFSLMDSSLIKRRLSLDLESSEVKRLFVYSCLRYSSILTKTLGVQF